MKNTAGPLCTGDYLGIMRRSTGKPPRSISIIWKRIARPCMKSQFQAQLKGMPHQRALLLIRTLRPWRMSREYGREKFRNTFHLKTSFLIGSICIGDSRTERPQSTCGESILRWFVKISSNCTPELDEKRLQKIHLLSSENIPHSILEFIPLAFSGTSSGALQRYPAVASNLWHQRRPSAFQKTSLYPQF